MTGIQRVLRETHMTVTDILALDGVRMVPLHTRDYPPQPVFRESEYLASDPVLDQRPVGLADVDVALFLDLHTDVDLAHVFRERRHRKLPVVSLIHDILPITHSEWCAGDPRRAFRVYVQQLLAVSDHIIVSTEWVKS